MPETPIQLIRLYERTPDKSLFGPYTVLPGLTPDQVKAAEAQHGCEFPRALRDLLYQCGGLEFEAHAMSWDAVDDPFGLFPGSIHLMDDGSGNYWTMELSPERLGPVWFCCHDPSVIVYQAHDLADFLERVLSGKELAATDGEIWKKGADGGKREGEWIVFDLSDEKIGSGAPMRLYYDEIMGLKRDGTTLKFRIKYRKRKWWQRFLDKWN